MLRPCGKQSTISYYIDAIDANVHSLEEINYFIYNHLNLVYREFFSDELLAYIENALDRSDLADGLKVMKDGEASLKDMTMYFLKTSGYYSEDELAHISGLILNLDTLSREERLAVEGDRLFKEGKFRSALKIYQEILKEDGTEASDKKPFLARIAFSAGVIYARFFECANANSMFRLAYDLYPDNTYVKASIYLSIILEDDEELLRSIIKYKISDETLETIRKRVDSMTKEVERDNETRLFSMKFTKGEDIAGAVSELKDDYYTMLA